MKKIVYALLLSSFLSSNAQVNLTSSLTACYALDASAAEPINNLTGTLSAVTPTVNRFNTANTAYYFSGITSSYIRLPNSPLLKPNEITFSAWVKANVLNGVMDVVFAKNTSSSYFSSFSLGVMNTGSAYKFVLYRQNGSSDNVATSITTVNANTWYHLAFSINSSAMKLYVNGVLEDNVAATITSFNYDPTRYVILGGTNESYNDPWNGSIDNARFYNRILSTSEVSAIYTQDPSCIPTPASSFSLSPPSLCAGGLVTLTDLSSNTPTSWNWQIQGSATTSASVSNPTVTLQNPGTYTISLTSSNGVGIGTTVSQTLVVLPNPVVAISPNAIVCAGNNVTLTATGAATYSWNTNQTGSAIVVNPMQNTTYSVVGTGTNGCKSTAQFLATVNQGPVVSISGNTIICEGASTSLLLGGTALTYTWSNGSSGNLITVTPSVSTIYTVTGTGNNGCTSSISQAIQVNTNPPVIIIVNNNPICLGDPLILSGAGANTYTWTGGVTNGIAFYPTTTAGYTVTGTGTNSCKSSATVQVAVNPKPVLITSSSMSVNTCPGEPVTLSASGANTYSWSTGDVTPMVTVTPTITSGFTVTGTDANGCKALFVFTQNVNACTGIREVTTKDNFEIYPNPFNAELIISNNSGGEIRIEVYNALGEKIVERELISPSTKLELNDQANGIYFIKIYSNSKLVKQQKIIKSNL